MQVAFLEEAAATQVADDAVVAPELPAPLGRQLLLVHGARHAGCHLDRTQCVIAYFTNESTLYLYHFLSEHQIFIF